MPNVGPAEIWIDDWMGLSTMTVNGAWEFITGNAGPEASIISLDVNKIGLYLDLDVPAGFKFLGEVTADIGIPAVENLAKDAFVDAIRSQLQVLVPKPAPLSLLAMSLLLVGRKWR